MNNDDILKQYIPLLNFLGDVLGAAYEIVLHNFKNPDASVIAISHGELSDRKVGAPMTDLALKIFQNANGKDTVLHYSATGPQGKVFKSSTLFIRNPQGEKIGALCINMDTEYYRSAYDVLGKLCGFTDAAESREIHEHLNINSEETLELLIKKVSENSIIPPEQMNPDEKIELARQMYADGAFLYKKSVPVIAKALHISEPTMYRYLSRIKKEQGNS